METDALVLAVGVAGLWGGTELAVRGAARLGRAFGVSEGFLGLTVFAIGTDIPEWLVAIEGGWQRLDGIATSGLVVGNAIGSTIAQGALVLGIAGLGGTLRLAPREVRRDGIPLLLAAVVLFVLAWDGSVTRAEGAVLMATYAVYATTLLRAEGVLFSVRRARAAHRASSWAPPLAALLAGLAVVVASAHAVIGAGMAIAERVGVSQSLIGVFLVGAGTSLPELALSIGAVARGRVGLSIGNVIGSNVFDLLVPIGTSGLLAPLAIEDAALRVDIPAAFAVCALGLLGLLRKGGLHPAHAASLVAAYVAYGVVRLGGELG